MSWTGRNNQCWKANTPDEVGPGLYQMAMTKVPRTSTAPFDSAEPRLNSSTSQSSSPGYYLGHKSWGSKSSYSSAFGSKVPRLSSVREKTPGPGAYNLVPSHTKVVHNEKHFPIQVEVYRTPPSIPSREIKEYNLGPGSYDPSYHDNKPVSRGTAFGAYVAKREIFEGTGEGAIGPGHYTTSVEGKSKLTWMFNSTAKKVTNEKIIKNQSPGPGSYEVKNQVAVRDSGIGFGSNARRDIPLSSDPHRPFVSSSTKSPPIGNYLSKEEQEKIEKLKKKLITADYPVEKAPFGTSDKREKKFSSETPGPGTYQAMLEKNVKGLFPNKSPRFTKIDSDTPGPGTYEPNLPVSAQNQKFLEKSPRFKKEPAKPSQMQSSYERHKPWSVKQTRSPDFRLIEKNLSFDTTGVRFHRERLSGPGPGQYDVRSKSVTMKNSRIGGKRSSVYGDYRPKTGTSLNVGPGAYELSENSRKTFNMAKELGKSKVWL